MLLGIFKDTAVLSTVKVVPKSLWATWLDSQYYNPLSFVVAFGSIATAFAVYYAFRQVRTSKVQQFESTFFKLIDLHYTIIANLSHSSYGNQSIAGDVIDSARRSLAIVLSNEKKLREDASNVFDPYIFTEVTSKEQANQVFFARYHEDYYSNFESDLNHYFRNLYHILKYIDQSALVDSKKRTFYASILRAQLSQNQLYILLFNSMQNGYGYPNAMYLIKKYNMMKNFRDEDIIPHYYWDIFNDMKKDVRPSEE